MFKEIVSCLLISCLITFIPLSVVKDVDTPFFTYDFYSHPLNLYAHLTSMYIMNSKESLNYSDPNLLFCDQYYNYITINNISLPYYDRCQKEGTVYLCDILHNITFKYYAEGEIYLNRRMYDQEKRKQRIKLYLDLEGNIVDKEIIYNILPSTLLQSLDLWIYTSQKYTISDITVSDPFAVHRQVFFYITVSISSILGLFCLYLMALHIKENNIQNKNIKLIRVSSSFNTKEFRV